MTNNCQIIGSVILSDAGMILIKGYIQAIMQTILNTPMDIIQDFFMNIWIILNLFSIFSKSIF